MARAFRQRRADGVWKMDGVRLLFYHLDRLQGQDIVYLGEGEKDADRLWALDWPGTTSPGGAGKWRPEYTQQLTAAAVGAVVIFPHNDDPGRQHAETAAASCHAAGLKVKVVTLPDLPPKEDVSYWLAAGHTKQELSALVKTTSLYVPATQRASTPQDERRVKPAPAAPVLIQLANVQPEAVEFCGRDASPAASSD